MARADAERSGDARIRQVNHAITKKRGVSGPLAAFQRAKFWLLVDADRRGIVLLLTVGVFATTMLVGTVGPVSATRFLLDGTAISDAYIEIQTGIVTVITIVLSVNQLVLSPGLGPISRQRQRLTDAVDLRTAVENIADVTVTSTEPAEFLGTLAGAISHRARGLADALSDLPADERANELDAFVDDVTTNADRVSEALQDEQFGRIEFVGVAMHLDSSDDLQAVRRLRNEYGDELSNLQRKALEDVVDVLERYTTAREYLRTLYIRAEFTRFSRTMLYAGVPAYLVAHFAVGIIGPNALPGRTLGVVNLLWFESAVFALSALPVLVLTSYVARLVTLSETSIFVSPFEPGPTFD